jgi:hypothetical protein
MAVARNSPRAPRGGDPRLLGMSRHPSKRCAAGRRASTGMPIRWAPESLRRFRPLQCGAQSSIGMTIASPPRGQLADAKRRRRNGRTGSPGSRPWSRRGILPRRGRMPRAARRDGWRLSGMDRETKRKEPRARGDSSLPTALSRARVLCFGWTWTPVSDSRPRLGCRRRAGLLSRSILENGAAACGSCRRAPDLARLKSLRAKPREHDAAAGRNPMAQLS